jgi:hypothetical protein
MAITTNVQARADATADAETFREFVGSANRQAIRNGAKPPYPTLRCIAWGTRAVDRMASGYGDARDAAMRAARIAFTAVPGLRG